MSIFANIGAIITIALCGYGLFFPKKISEQSEIGLRLDTPIAVSEMRATYAAMVAVGIAVLLMQSDTAAMMLGIAWLGSFWGRQLSVIVDKSWSNHVAVSSVLDMIMFVLLVN